VDLFCFSSYFGSLATLNALRAGGALQKARYGRSRFARMALQSAHARTSTADGIESRRRSSLMPTFDIDGDHYAARTPGRSRTTASWCATSDANGRIGDVTRVSNDILW